jgi:hypothetical protein
MCVLRGRIGRGAFEVKCRYLELLYQGREILTTVGEMNEADEADENDI